ncbi:MAG: hypothetical protein R3D85_12375 [Paracoccaceae bacterium]
MKVTPKEFSGRDQDFNNCEYDMRLGGSGGDYDPDDGIVDWMMTGSRSSTAAPATPRNMPSAISRMPKWTR